MLAKRTIPTLEQLETRRLLTGDVVTEWNRVASEVLVSDTEYQNPGMASRSLAMMNLAIYDAVNGIDAQNQQFYHHAVAAEGASLEAAAIQAAYSVLSETYPSQAEYLEAERTTALDEVPDGPSEILGILYGNTVADNILSTRLSDGFDQSVNYQPSGDVGDWAPDPVNPDQEAWGPAWGSLDTFAVVDSNQMMPPAMPALTSAEYTEAFDEVKALGGIDSVDRTAEQTEIGVFWAYDRLGMGTPMRMYNKIMRDVAIEQGNTVSENARLFAMTFTAVADAGITAWDSKFEFDFWRPVTGIQRAAEDGNPDTVADPDWIPLGAPGGIAPDGSVIPDFTPPFPTYLSGHASFGGALFASMENFYGTDEISFEVTSDELPGTVRSFDSFSQASAENGRSRVYLGIHWNFDDTVARETGAQVADYVADNYFQTQGGLLVHSEVPESVDEGELFAMTAIATNYAGNDLIYHWDFGGVVPPVSSRAAVIAFPDQGDGSFDVTLRVSNPAGDMQYENTFAINVSNVAPTVDLLGPGQLETGLAYSWSAALTDPGGTSDPISWDWDFGDGSPHATGANPVHRYQQPGIYDVHVIAMDDEGATSESQLQITVTDMPMTSASAQIIYDAETGGIQLDAELDLRYATLTSQSGALLGGDGNTIHHFDNAGFDTLDFGQVLAPGLDQSFLIDDLRISGFKTIGVDLTSVELIYRTNDSDIQLAYLSESGEMQLHTGLAISTLELTSDGGLFQGAQPDSLTGDFDVFRDDKLFKLEPTGFASLEFGEVLPTGLTGEAWQADLHVDGSMECISRPGNCSPLDDVALIHVQTMNVTEVVAAPGDFDGDGLVNVDDIGLLCAAMDSGDLHYDISSDGNVTSDDMDTLIIDILGTSYGDSNLDGLFDSGDLVSIFQTGEFEDSVVGNSTWATGDWNCDGEFDTSDLVAAFQQGAYVNGATATLTASSSPDYLNDIANAVQNASDSDEAGEDSTVRRRTAGRAQAVDAAFANGQSPLL